jgi:hypothetical protein
MRRNLQPRGKRKDVQQVMGRNGKAPLPQAVGRPRLRGHVPAKPQPARRGFQPVRVPDVVRVRVVPRLAQAY